MTEELNRRHNLATIPTINNNGESYIVPFDIYKEGYDAYDISNWFKGRVGDNGTPFGIRWYKHGQLMDVTGMRPFIEGQVGDYTIDDSDPDDPKINMDSEASNVHVVGEVNDCQEYGVAIYRLINQAIPQSGIFYGKIGVMGTQDDGTTVMSSVDVIFKVLAGHMNMLGARKFYVSELEKAEAEFKARLKQHDQDYQQRADQHDQEMQKTIDDARNAYESETKNAHDSLDALKSQIQANRDEQNTLVERLIGVKQQIDANDIVKKYVYNDYVKKNEARLDATSQSITDQLKNLKLDLQFTTLNDLKTKYPNGSNGVYILENGNLAVYQNNQWSDSGKLVITNGANYRMFVTQDQIVMPYDSLNTLPTNSITVYGNLTIDNNPIANDSIIVLTLGPTEKDYQFNYACMQFVFGQNINDVLCRMCWVNADKTRSWKPWNKITKKYSIFSDQSQIAVPYDDLNTLPTNSITLYGTLEVKNSPWPNQSIYVETEGPNNGLSANYARKQTVISQSTGEQATRLSWVGLDGREEWKPWNKNEMLPSLSFMDTFTVIGDSYSAGHLSDMKGSAISPTRFAWGNILAKDIGAKCVNLSVSGYTAYDWATNKISDLNKTPVQDLYIIALGINDALPSHGEALGTIADINDDPNKNANTFYGNYGKIISAIKHHDMNARIILLTIMTKYDSTSRKDEFNTAIKNIGAKYNIPVADLDQESYFASDDFNNLKNGGHPTIVGYSLMARALKHAIQKTIYQNNTYFDEWVKTMD